MDDSWTEILIIALLLALLPFSVSAVVLPEAGCQCPIGLTFAAAYNSTNPDLPDYGYLACQYGNYPNTPYLASGIGAEVVVRVGSNLYSDFQSYHKMAQELGIFSKQASNRRVIQFEDEPNRISLIYFETPNYGKPVTNAYLHLYYQNSFISAYIMSFEENDAKMIAILDSLESCGMGIVGRGGESKNCTTVCSAKAPHLIWDEQSEYPECSCICEKGWEMQDLGLTVRCNPCTDICQAKDPNLLYDTEESGPNVCECSCRPGYEKDYSTDSCKKVECPANATNTADLTTPCSQDRILNRHCCCNEGFLQYNLECSANETTSAYFLQPTTAEIEIGKTVQFSVTEERLGRYLPVSNDKIQWSITQAKSINVNLANAEIGTIDATGSFTGKGAGTCTVVATVDNKEKLKADVTVKCPSTPQGDINEILQRYISRIPTGPFHQDLQGGKISRPFSSMNPGYATNLISLSDKEYGKFTCGAYQDLVLKFLHNLQSNPEECTLLNGYEFGPIEGSYGGHHAVVIYPKGSNWKETGIVLDPWYHQRPEYMTIGTWRKVFSPVAGDTTASYRLNYPTTQDSSDFKYAFWTAAEAYVTEMTSLGGLIKCPVELSITDASGKRMEIRPDGTPVHDIPESYLLRTSDEKGGYEYYFNLDLGQSSSYNLQMTGRENGSFEVILYNRKMNTYSYYGEQPIRSGETAEISLTPQTPASPLLLPDKSRIVPLQFSDEQGYSALIFESRSRPPGSNVQIPLTLLLEGEQVGNMDLTLRYDPSVLKATGVVRGGLTENSLFDSNIQSGTIRIGIASKEGFTGGGSIAQVQFDVVGAVGSISPLRIESVDANRAKDNSALPIPTLNGVFVVISATEARGDASGDRKVTALDALMALQMAVGKRAEDLTLDMDGNGKITSLDARQILKMAVE